MVWAPRQKPSPAVPAIWAIFFLLPWIILFTWAYNKSKGSILVSVFFHATSGAALSFAAKPK